MTDTLHCERVIIGGGVLGLAIAARLANEHTFLFERHARFGMENSSRNSEVIHSGIHYPATSLKTQLCLEGRGLLYDFSRHHQVPHRRCGKLVVATQPQEQEYLHRLVAHSKTLGVLCETWDRNKILEREPQVEAIEAIYFPDTGIIDSHALMATLENQAARGGVHLLYGHGVTHIERDGNSWCLEVQAANETFQVRAACVINAAGLGAARLANLALGQERYSHRFCRGRYFALHAGYQNAFSRLIYPVPQKDGLGVHVTLDLAGQVRLGPDTDWCEDSDPSHVAKHYECDWESLRPTFEFSVRKYFPALKSGAMDPGLVGIRPKLFIDGKPHPDFYLKASRGWVDCLGIESPGLTASLAIAERVAGLSNVGRVG